MAEGSGGLTIRFGPLATALCGRTLQIAPAQPGEQTYTDGHAIFLAPDAADPHVEVAMQCALIQADSVSLRFMVALLGRPERARRFLALEATRILSVGSPLLTLVTAGLGVQARVVTASADASLTASADRRLPAVTHPLLGALRPSKVIAAGGPVRAQPRPEDLSNTSTVGAQQPDELEDEEEADELPGFLKRLSSPLNLPNFITSLFHQAMGSRRAPGTEAPGMEIPTTALRRSRAPSASGVLSRHVFDDGEPAAAAALLGRWIYPEWDAARARYRLDWCTVQEIAFRGTADHLGRRRFRHDARLDAALRKLARGLARHRRQRDGDQLDLDGVIDAAASQLAARLGRETADDVPAIYQALRRTRQDLAALILIDISGSVAERSFGGGPIIDEQLQAAAALTQALSVAGNRVGALAFHARGRDGGRAVLLKSFAEPHADAAIRAIMALTPSGYTRLGAGIRHAAHQLMEGAGVERRLLVIVSDGVPYDMGYSGRHACEDVAHALAEAAAKGLRVLWLCFGAMTPELALALRRGPHHLVEAESYHRLRVLLPRAMEIALFGGGPGPGRLAA